MALEFFKNLFFDSGPETMSFFKLHSRLRKWKESRSYPYDYELPEAISLPSDFWKRVVELYQATRSDRHERAISVFWADGDLILSSVVRGDTRSVTPRNNVMVKYLPSTYKGYFRKEVYVDDKLYSKREIYHTKAPKVIDVEFLFNMHTHPPHTSHDGTTFYTFFSLQDLKSLLLSESAITGMIGDKLWLLFRTRNSPKVLNNFDEREISIESLEERLKIAVYGGEFNQKLYRVKNSKS